MLMLVNWVHKSHKKQLKWISQTELIFCTVAKDESGLPANEIYVALNWNVDKSIKEIALCITRLNALDVRRSDSHLAGPNALELRLPHWFCSRRRRLCLTLGVSLRLTLRSKRFKGKKNAAHHGFKNGKSVSSA